MCPQRAGREGKVGRQEAWRTDFWKVRDVSRMLTYLPVFEWTDT